ncbi:hypothetical protein OG780_11460 [Streptomyces sp. NBC_00386]
MFDAVTANYKDDEGVGRALAAFHAALLPVLDPSALPRRRLFRRRGTSS